MKIIRDISESVRKVYGPLFPTSSVKKKEFIDKVRDKVAHYKPRIEDKCNINLGNVDVKDNKEWLNDICFNDVSIRATEMAWDNSRVANESDFNYMYTISSLSYFLLQAPLFLYHSFRGADFRYYKNTIYVPFYYQNRFFDIDFKEREKRLDYGVVHELSHSLWDKIAGSKSTLNPFFLGLEWFEGFATYCTEDYFTLDNPINLKKVRVNGRYISGKEKVCRVIQNYGEEHLLDIPKNWQEFEKLIGIFKPKY
jgi:hypothetical protein